MRSEAENNRILAASASQMPGAGQIQFPQGLDVSKKSKFKDLIWSWEDNFNPRLSTCPRDLLRVDWSKMLSEFNLTAMIVEDLKKYVFLRLNHSKVIFNAVKKNAHPSTAVMEVRRLADFLSHMRGKSAAGGVSFIDSFTDIKVQDLRDCLATYPHSVVLLKRILMKLGSEAYRKHLGYGKLGWNVQDILSMNWGRNKEAGYSRLPADIFLLLSSGATKDVKHFLRALELEICDTSEQDAKSNVYLDAFSNFGAVFREYVEYRKSLFAEGLGHQRRRWVVHQGGRVKLLRSLIDRAQLAAQAIIMMYTGARLSEFTSFKLGCLRSKGNFWVIVGTVIKGRPIDADIDTDEWIAIPIVQDAVKVLEQTAHITNTNLLFHDVNFVPRGFTRVMTSSNITGRVKRYLKLIAPEKDWTEVKTYAYLFRNSLIFEMRKSGLGLPFITYQLKHLYNSLERTINNTTIGYGSIGADAVEKAIDDANLVAVKSLYYPESPVGGGGAEEHTKRRAAYFHGMVSQGVTIDETLRRLANEGGMPLTDVGLGYCQGQNKVMVDGVESDPPCIGALRCNPVQCSNAVIPEHKLPMWRKLSTENRLRAADPEFAHVKSYLLEAVAEAEGVIEQFETSGQLEK